MKLPGIVRRALLRRMKGVAGSRAPDFIIGGAERPYLKRWWLIPRNRWFNVYLHHFLRSDDDRALHTHPWHSVSIILEGAYREHLENGVVNLRPEGSIGGRGTHSGHRVELLQDAIDEEIPAWTLFVTGPKVREWFFLCPKGPVHWKVFTKSGAQGEIGPSCGE